jgi:hypothetical protein
LLNSSLRLLVEAVTLVFPLLPPPLCLLDCGEGVVAVGVVPNSLQDIGRASDGAKRRPVKSEAERTVHIYPC